MSNPLCLVVDDEPRVRTYITIVLQSGGFETIEAENGVRALDALRSHPRKVDLIVSDVSMPLMNGQALAASVNVEFPGIPIILITGYTPTPTADVPMLQKPFLPGALLSAASDALARFGSAGGST
jgi:two-component system chemotaxis response regulator CheY